MNAVRQNDADFLQAETVEFNRRLFAVDILLPAVKPRSFNL
jgi:hypothetical protein